MPAIAHLESFVRRHPIQTPAPNSFCTVRARSAMCVRRTEIKGTQGEGEVWCNFSTVGAGPRPIAHCIARLDIALWDLATLRALDAQCLGVMRPDLAGLRAVVVPH